MARKPRISVGGAIYHVLNRSNAKTKIFRSEGDYLLFREILQKTSVKFEIDVLAYCIMPNHWHLLIRPKHDGGLSKFMKMLTATHVQKYHSIHNTQGTGHLYQGRFKSFLVTTNEYTLQLCRYIERNPVKAGLVSRAEIWKWSSLQERISLVNSLLLSKLPIDLPVGYLEWVNDLGSDPKLGV